MALTQISTAGVKDDAVTAGKIPANAVGSSELADNAVDTAAIAVDAVTTSRIADNSITTALISDANVTNAKLANDAVTTSRIADNSVTTAKIAGSAVTTAKIAGSAVDSTKIADGTIGAGKLSSNAITTDKIADGNVTAAKLASGVQTTINNNADNRVITGSGTANTLNGESGLTFDGTDVVAIGTATSGSYDGNQKLRLGRASDCNIAIRTTGNTTSHTGISFGDNDSSEAGFIKYYHNDNSLRVQTNASERMRIDSNGDVGIGSTNPTEKLEINLGTDKIVQFTGGIGQIGNVAGIFAVNDAKSEIADFGIMGNTLKFASGTAASGAERMRITSAGYVGINTTSPERQLHIVGNDGATGATIGNSDTCLVLDNQQPNGTIMEFLSDTNGAGRIMFTDPDASNQGQIVYQHSGDAMYFVANGAEAMRIDSAGGLRINTTGTVIADELLSIAESGTTHELCGFRINNQSHTKDMITMAHVANSGDRMFIRFKRTGSLTNIGSINTNPSQTAFNTSSDYRLKENQVLISDGITRLKQLKPYRFNFKIEPDKTVDGFYAHEVTSIVPEAVSGVKDAMEVETYYEEGETLPEGKSVGDPKTYSTTIIDPQGLDYGKFTPLLTAALQEEIAKREALETRVAALEAA